MLNYQQMEFLTYERQKGFLDEAAQRRLAKLLPPPNRPQRYRQIVRRWAAAQLVQSVVQLLSVAVVSPHQFHSDFSDRPSH